MKISIIIFILLICNYTFTSAKTYTFDMYETSGGDYSVSIDIQRKQIMASKAGSLIFKYNYQKFNIDNEAGIIGFSFESNIQPLLRPSRPNHYFIIETAGIFCNTADDKKSFKFKPNEKNDYIQKYYQLFHLLSDNKDVFFVSTAKDFVKSLGSNRTIIISEGATINLSEALTMDYYTNDELQQIKNNLNSPILGYEFVDDIIIKELYLKSLRNLTIKGSSDLNLVRLITEEEDAMVIDFDECDNIILENLIIGHEIKPVDVTCFGDVLYVNNSNNITINNCELFGCGINGISGQTSNYLTCNNVKIYDCTENIINVFRGPCNNWLFKECLFYNNGGGICLDSNCTNFEFVDCQFKNNRGELINSNCESLIKMNSCIVQHNLNNIGQKELLMADEKTIFKHNYSEFISTESYIFDMYETSGGDYTVEIDLLNGFIIINTGPLVSR